MTLATERTKADNYLWGVALFALLYCVFGFGLRAATDPDTQARFTLPVIGHALLMTAWLVLFVWQIHLRRERRIARHRANGTIGAGIAGLLVPLGIYISWAAGREFGAPFFFTFNAAAFVGFGILVVFALRAALAGNIDRHRRFMLVGTLLFTGPATARWLPMIGAPPLLAPPVLLLVLIGLPLVYDLLEKGRWQRASMAASGIAVASIIAGALAGILIGGPPV